MAKLKASNRGGTGSLPFLNTLLDQGIIPDYTQIREEVLSLYETQSRAGYLIVTEKWQHMVYKSSSMCEIIESLIQDLPNSDPGQSLWFVGDEEESCGYYLETDDNIGVLWKRRKGMGKSSGIERTSLSPLAVPGSSQKKPRHATRNLG